MFQVCTRRKEDVTLKTTLSKQNKKVSVFKIVLKTMVAAVLVFCLISPITLIGGFAAADNQATELVFDIPNISVPPGTTTAELTIELANPGMSVTSFRIAVDGQLQNPRITNMTGFRNENLVNANPPTGQNHSGLFMWTHGVFGNVEPNPTLTVQVQIPASAPAGVVGTVFFQAGMNNFSIDGRTPVELVGTPGTVRIIGGTDENDEADGNQDGAIAPPNEGDGQGTTPEETPPGGDAPPANQGPSGGTQVPGGNVPGTGPIATVEAPDTSAFFTEYHNAFLIGAPDGTIRPHSNITRAEVVTVLFRLLNDEYRTEMWGQNNRFSDVNSSQWFNNAVSTLANAGIVSDAAGGAFRPNDAITRAEFSAMVARFFNEAESKHGLFTDVDGTWAEGYINRIASFGWVQGAGDGTFNPNANLTRAEAAAIINRMLNRVKSSADDLLPGRTRWPDMTNTNAWYYLYLQEATHSTEFERLPDGSLRWTAILPDIDWTVLERPTSSSGAILTARAVQQGAD